MDIEDIKLLAEMIEIPSTPSSPDYTSYLQDLVMKLNESNDILKFILCFLIIFAICLVCRFAYKHFNQFFM